MDSVLKGFHFFLLFLNLGSTDARLSHLSQEPAAGSWLQGEAGDSWEEKSPPSTGMSSGQEQPRDTVPCSCFQPF